jgi:chemotaxis signal transduction protein
VRGLTSVDGKMVMLLDIDQLVASCISTPAVREATR